MPMPKQVAPDVLTERLQEHQAFRAWCQVQSDHLEPGSIEVLKYKIYGAVYRLNGIRPDGTAVIAKRCRQATGHVEHVIYEQLLPRIPGPMVRCYGFLREPEGEFCWLFLEDAADGPYSAQVAQHRVLAAYWLGKMHLAPVPAEIKAQLPKRGLDYYLQSLHNCRAALLAHVGRTALAVDDTALFGRLVVFCDELESQWDQIEKTCEVMPHALVHGDFVVKNLRVQHDATGPALLVFDWQFSGWGIPATDLAQFIGHVASPDLAVYRSVLNRQHPSLDARDIQRVAACGNLLRALDEIDWAISGLPFGDPTSLGKAVSHLRVYETRLSEALGAFRRSRHD
jgi:hypothetical protein